MKFILSKIYKNISNCMYVKELAGTSVDIIELKDHDPSWAMEFQRERDRIASCLGEAAVSIDHIGSTAVPGLRAKPVIDIMVSVRHLDLGKVDGPLSSIGYVHVPIDDEGRLFFRKGMPRTHHLHVVVADSDEHWKHIRFRDRLIAHPEDAEEYARLKEDLAERYRTDRVAYSNGKDDLITKILTRDASEGRRETIR
jgi:GrpB-like predicted nucleotidyltransferase (UPF0157 family)